jgi:peptide-methionine (S)-S-oxide reductase
MTAQQPSTGAEIATLGGGCFWCIEAVFDSLQGVSSVESGYTGGNTVNPTYKQICNGDTGHAEVVRVTFDPAVISFREMLAVFFAIHDPTTLNCQDNNDVGTQYRSAIFYHTPAQKEAAEKFIAEMTAVKLFSGKIVTEVLPAPTFYVAEDDHQEYFANNVSQPYCQAVVAPKVAKFRNKFADRIKQ